MTDRTAADYAIEHAGYMAVRAEALLAALHDEATGVPEDERVSVAECSTMLRSGIYEFRKRAEAARAALSATPASAEVAPVAYLGVRANEWGRLYTTANALVARIGYKGEIDSRADEVESLQDALHDLDGGEWMPGLMPHPAAVPEAAVRDAARYRWLRENYVPALSDFDDDHDAIDRAWHEPEKLDRAIDQAIAAHQEQPK